MKRVYKLKKKYKTMFISMILVFVLSISFAINPTLMENSLSVARNAFYSIARFISSDEDNSAVAVEETIPLNRFEFSGLANDYSWPEDWDYVVAGNVTQDSVPKFEGYKFVNATVDGVPAKSLGVFERKNGSKFYFYRTNDDPLENDVSVPGIPDTTKIVLNYVPVEAEITYEIKMKDGSTLPKGITNDVVFGTNRPTSTVDLVYSFDVRIPGGYTGEVYRYVGNNKIPEHLTENRAYPLGTSPVYVYGGVDTSKGPSTFQANASFSESNVTVSRHIVVELTKKDAPTFDASSWVKTDNARGRGNTAEWPLVVHNATNYESEDRDWDWGSRISTGPTAMTKDDDGSYSFTWFIQTNTGNWVFDSFELNGSGITLPFTPIKIIDKDGNDRLDSAEVANGKSEKGVTYEETVLLDGTVVKVEYIRLTNTNQRAYQIDITNAHSDIVVTGGNLNDFQDGAPEISIYSLVGINADENNPTVLSVETYGPIPNTNNNVWTKRNLANVVVLNEFSFSGDPSSYNANVRFKLMPGYENPTYSLETRYKKVIENQTSQGITTDSSDKIYGPDKDGYYYIKINDYDKDANRISLLNISATPIRYTVAYESGEKVTKTSNMPDFSSENGMSNRSLYDNNAGSYYDRLVNDLITINSNIPIDSNDVYAFSYWGVLDEEGKLVNDVQINPAKGVSLEDYYQYGVYDADLKSYVIHLQAQWEKKAQPFTYFVSLQWTDQYGEIHKLEEPIQHVKTQNLLATGEELNIFINIESLVLKNWMSEHPTYILNPDKNQDFLEVVDNGIIYIELVESRGGLAFSNEVRKEADDDNEFEYIIKGEDIPDGEYTAYSKENNENLNAEDAIDVIFENNEAKITLKRDDGIVLYVPFGKYTITQVDNKLDFNYDVKINNEAVEKTEITVDIELGNIPDEILFTNTVKTTKVKITASQDPEFIDDIEPGKVVNYTVTIVNEGRETAYNVDVTNIIPHGMINPEIIDFSVGEVEIKGPSIVDDDEIEEPDIEYDEITSYSDEEDELSEDVITWIIGNMESNATETLTFKAQLPYENVSNNTWDNVSRVKYDNIPDDYDGEVVSKFKYKKLPSTGQLWWLVSILVVLGLLFIIVGFVIKRKGTTSEEK